LDEIQTKVYYEKVRFMHNQSAFMIVGSTVCAIVVTFYLWQELPQELLAYWLLAHAVTAVIRLWIVYAYLRADDILRKKRIWGNLCWFGSMLTGIVWAVWPWVFCVYASPETELVMLVIFAGMVAVSASSGGIYMPVFFAFSVPLVSLSAVHILSRHESTQLTGVLLVLYLGVNIVLAMRASRENRRLIVSQLENEMLIERLAEEKHIAERAMDAKSRFLAAASHDLRQPLHAMGLFLNALRSRETDEKNVHIIDDMSKSAEALNSLFSSLLDVSRLDAEIIDFNPEHVKAGRLFDALRAQFEQRAAEKGIRLRISTGEHVLHCDMILLERVLRNLLSNAIRYTHTGSIHLHCADWQDGKKLISVEDTGIGIPSEFTEDVFSEYYQLNNPGRDREKGLGLGLSIVRRLCELMDLPLEMQSEEGKGTAFRLVVPGGDPAKVTEQSVPAISSKITGEHHVLVIDDEIQVLKSMRHMLEGWGCNVMLAESARDALKIIALSEVIPTAIVSDYRLGNDLNGVDAVAVVRESIDVCIPAIIVSGDSSPERLKEVKDTGLQFMHKPVNPDELRAALQSMYENSNTGETTIGNEVKTGLVLQPAANQ